jgi:hypothetical protein
MPSLADLKANWFPLHGDVLGVPRRRREGSPGPERPSTDGSTIELRIDGQAYAQRSHAELTVTSAAAHAQPDPQSDEAAIAEAYHAGWRLEPVHVGFAPAALTDPLEACDPFKTATVLGSGPAVAPSRQPTQRVRAQARGRAWHYPPVADGPLHRPVRRAARSGIRSR